MKAAFQIKNMYGIIELVIFFGRNIVTLLIGSNGYFLGKRADKDVNMNIIHVEIAVLEL